MFKKVLFFLMTISSSILCMEIEIDNEELSLINYENYIKNCSNSELLGAIYGLLSRSLEQEKDQSTLLAIQELKEQIENLLKDREINEIIRKEFYQTISKVKQMLKESK